MRRNERELINRDEFLDVFTRGDVCRLAISDEIAPYIVPLNFGMIWENELPILYFHSAGEGRKIELLAKNGRVGFEIDVDHQLVKHEKACGWGMTYKSIIGVGEVSQVVDETEKRLAMDTIMRHYGHPAGEIYYKPQIFAKTTILRLDILQMSAKARLE